MTEEVLHSSRMGTRRARGRITWGKKTIGRGEDGGGFRNGQTEEGKARSILPFLNLSHKKGESRLGGGSARKWQENLGGPLVF